MPRQIVLIHFRENVRFLFHRLGLGKYLDTKVEYCNVNCQMEEFSLGYPSLEKKGTTQIGTNTMAVHCSVC